MRRESRVFFLLLLISLSHATDTRKTMEETLSLLEVTTSSEPPTTAKEEQSGAKRYGRALWSVFFLSLGTYIMFRKPEVALDPQSTPLLHIFGLVPRERNQIGLRIVDVAFSFMSGLFFFFYGLSTLWIGARENLAPRVFYEPMPSDSHLASLTTAEWIMHTTATSSPPDCSSLNREESEQSNDGSICGFCNSAGGIAASDYHGPHTSACVAALPVASTLCASFGRDSIASTTTAATTTLCGDCAANSYGFYSPSRTVCQACQTCDSDEFLYGCSGPNPGKCLTTCPAGTYESGTTCVECPITTTGTTTTVQYVSGSGCANHATCTWPAEMSRSCNAANTSACASSQCKTMPSLTIEGTTARFGVRSIAEKYWGTTTKHVDHFTVATAEGPRGHSFTANKFEYEWTLNSNSHTEGFRYIYYPYEIATAVRIGGQLRTPARYDRSGASVLIQVPSGTSTTYAKSNTWLITADNIFNKKNGWLFPIDVYDVQARTKLPDNDLIDSTWAANVWALSSDETPDELLTEKVMQPIDSNGNWGITTIITLPKDPATNQCPSLPLRIVVTGQDGKTRSVYTIHTVGSERSQCYDSLLARAMRVIHASNNT